MSALIIQSLPEIFNLITKMAPGFTHLVNYVREVRRSLQQSAEWTPELEQQWTASLLATNQDPAYRPDGV
jgi:hypothetical protein